MSVLLARLGHVSTKRAIQLIRSGGRGTRGGICEECSSTQQQRRSYGDDGGVRWTAGGVTFSGEDAKDPGTRNQQDTTTRNNAVKNKPTYTPFFGHEASGDAFFDQKSPDGQAWEPPTELEPDEDVSPEHAMWEQFERVQDEDDETTDMRAPHEAEDEPAEMENPPVGPRHGGRPHRYMERDLQQFEESSMLDIDYKAEFASAMQTRESDLLIRCMFAAERANDVDFIRSISSARFTEVMRIMDTTDFIDKVATTHVELNAAVAATIGAQSMYRVAYEWSAVLSRIVDIRRSADISLELEDYAILLRGARDMGSRRLGFKAWQAMSDQGLKPTTKHYNYLMGTIVWHGRHRVGTRQNVRVIPFNMENRAKRWRAVRFRNYRVDKAGIREQCMKIFNEMIAHGNIADEESFRLLITACAREGDIDTVKIILKKTWHIDVDAIMNGVDEQTILPRQISETSSLRPSVDFIFTLAHTFGINNDIPCALRVVDFVARHYNLTITNEVWSQLFEWAFVLSTHRSGTSRADGSTTGQLPQATLMSLWTTMTGPPYNIQPTMGMYNMLIKNLYRRGAILQLVEKIKEGEEVYEQHKKEAKDSWYILLNRLRDAGSGDGVETCRNEWEYRDLICRRDHFWLRRWIRLLLGAHRNIFHHAVDSLPQLLWHWRWYVPRTIEYETNTGFVEFEMWTKEERERMNQWKLERETNKMTVLESARKYVGHMWVHGGVHERPRPRRRKQGSGEPGSWDEDDGTGRISRMKVVSDD